SRSPCCRPPSVVLQSHEEHVRGARRRGHTATEQPMPNFLLAAVVAAQISAPTDTLRAPGLHHPVEILRDSSGIAHIRARDEHDLFFAQGWNAARDRLFQLELWRR